MPIVIEAVTEQGYKDWVAQQKGQLTQGAADTNKVWTLNALMTNGEKVYARTCAACHQPGGVGMPPTFPALKGSKIATGPVADHVNMVFNGKTGTAMQAFKNQLSDVDLASVITYERNAFGNHTNTSVQPIQIKALRDGKAISEALATKPSSAPAEASEVTPPKGKAASVAGAAPLPVAQPDNASVSAATAGTSASAAEDMKSVMMRGEKVYMSTCAVCHQPSGAGMPPTFPALKGSPIATGPIAGHIDRVLNGKPGTAMQAFKTQLSDQELADVITYERNAFGNNTGTLAKPDDIKAARQSS